MTTFTSYNVISAGMAGGFPITQVDNQNDAANWLAMFCFFPLSEKSCVFKLDMSAKVFGTIDTLYLGKHCPGEFIHMNDLFVLPFC